MLRWFLSCNSIFFSSFSKKYSELKEIIVETDPPVILKGGFTIDFRRIWIEFDKNINGETSCSALFTEDTYQMLGSGKLHFIHR